MPKTKSAVSFRAPAPLAAPENLPVPIVEEPYVDITGEIDASDVSHPRLALKHAIDTRFEDVIPGNLIAYLGEEHYSITPPIKVVAVGLKKFFLQVAEPGETPITAANAEEMEEAGGTLNLTDPELLHFRPAADITLLVAGLDPKKFDGISFFSVLGVSYAPMVFRSKNSAYEPTAKVLISWAAIKHTRHEPAPMCDYPYDFVILKSPWKGTTFFKPSLRRRREEPHSAAQIATFVEIAKNL